MDSERKNNAENAEKIKNKTGILFYKHLFSPLSIRNMRFSIQQEFYIEILHTIYLEYIKNDIF